eukprot:scaffold459157_cov33-Prasinocladus_malaysianus.AAC.1
MESTLRAVAGESSVAMLPPGPKDLLDLAEGEEVHYHYHYHPSCSGGVSPAFSPNCTSTSAGASPRYKQTAPHTAESLSNSLRRNGSFNGQLFRAEIEEADNGDEHDDGITETNSVGKGPAEAVKREQPRSEE